MSSSLQPPLRPPMRSRRRPPSRPDRSNEEWLTAIQSDGPELETALADLRPILVKALRITLAPRVDRGADALAEDLAQKALLLVRDRADQFRGDARFTTWAQKVAVRLAFSELRRKRWEDVPLDALIADPPSTPEPRADEILEETEAVATVRRLIAQELTDRQRTALEAVLAGMPLEEVARRLDTNRNALYKLLHDARQRLKRAFEEHGIAPDDLIDLGE